MISKKPFIVLEGVEGSGKSTQSLLLSERLALEGIDNLLVREPGSTNTGEKIRNLILQATELNPLSELFLFSAARSELIQNEILPALKSGLVVVCDRYTYSSIAYQGYAKGLDPNVISKINSIATERLDPNLVFLLDIEPKLSFGRKISDSMDRFEKESTEFHNQVRKGYLSLAKSNPRIWNIMDGQKPKKEIQELIWQKVSNIIA